MIRLLVAMLTVAILQLAACAPAGHSPAPASALFTEITDEVGLGETDPAWPDGTYFLPEIMGPGVALLDYDGDGDLDILQPRVPPPGRRDAPAPNRLYRQELDGSFVDVTADWCLTCQLNKKLVLERGAVQARLESEGVVAMRGDWTLPSDEISRYLEGFGRYGIPFDAVYGPGLPDGLALPEILTPDTVIEALERAVGERAAGG